MRWMVLLLAVVVLLPGCGGGNASSPETHSLSLKVGESRDLAASIAGSSGQTYRWTVQESNGGDVSQTGLYTAPATVGTYHVIAVKTNGPADRIVFNLSIVAVGSIGVGVSFPGTGDLPVTIRSAERR